MKLPNIDDRSTARRLEEFLAEKLRQTGLKGYIIGLSGGVDSALSAAIAVRAAGKEKVLGLIMPYTRSSQHSEDDARTLAGQLGIRVEKIEIGPMINAYFGDIDQIDPVRAGNKMARERMSILFDRAHELKYLVLGTSNRTEICLGYGTWYGDIACSVNPIGMLYKTYVRRLARYYDIPDSILNKPPTADLWPGQTDESELGLEYDRVDQLLYSMIEKEITDRKELNREGLDNALIDRAVHLLNSSYFKRRLPEIADTGLKTIPERIVIT